MKKQVSICGFKQNIYRLNNVSDTIVSLEHSNKEQKKYEILEKQMLANGYVESVVEKDYPINSDSVTSLAEGADYKNDPLQAIANAPVRVNLGDITEAQKFLENPQNFARVYEDTKRKLAEYYARQRVSSSEKQTENSSSKEQIKEDKQ